MQNWRMTLGNSSSFKKTGELNEYLVVDHKASLTLQGRTEFQSEGGDIIRYASSGHFSFIMGEEGLAPVIKAAEAFGVIINAWPKHNDCAWNCRLHSSPPVQIMWRYEVDKSGEFDTRSFYVTQGYMLLHSFDDRGRHLNISEIHAGQVATVRADLATTSRNKKFSLLSLTDIDDKTVDYIVNTYLDPRPWL